MPSFLRACGSCGLGLLLAAGLWAQAPKPPSTAEVLFQQAKAGLEPIPEDDRPLVLSQIVKLELPVFPKQAAADYKSIFQMSVALSPRGFGRYVKGQTELGSIIALVRQNELETALELARTGDTERNYMYNWVLERAATRWPLARTSALVRECAQVAGFPYQGALDVAKAAKDDAITQRQLVLAIYQAAGNETNLIDFGLTGGFAALAGGHELAPELDAQLESSLIAFLTRTGKEAQPINAPSAAKLMALLQQIDAPKAQELEAQFPALAAAQPQPPSYMDSGADGKFRERRGTPPQFTAQDMAKTDPEAALKFADGQGDPLDHFRALVAVAGAEAATHPDLARQAAKDAGALASSDDFLKQSFNAVTAAKLALAEDQLGDAAGARGLILRVLDLADQAAAEFESNFRALPLDAPDGSRGAQAMQSQRFLASQLGSQPIQTSVAVGVYGAAGTLDFGLAAQRAQKLPSDVLRPLVEATVAGDWKPGSIK
ncbi:MAG: hypothetical protein ACRD1E_00865 [Terriglobales bacterium]